MLRRSHKKSWGGCLQCKKRHVKCDEGRPACLLCNLSGRDCSFASQGPPQNLPTSSAPSKERPTSLGSRHNQRNVTISDDISSTAAVPSSSNPPECPSSNKHQDQSLEATIDLNHMELLIHLTIDKEMFSLSGKDFGDYSSTISFALKTALKSPYLMYQLLAFSARHLMFLHPDRSHAFQQQAVILQTRAVSLFNDTWTEISQSNCVAILLFSTILGHHLLADMLTKREASGLEGFISNFRQCVEMHRGSYTVARTAWLLLMESELEPILSWSSKFTTRQPRGDECQGIRALVDAAQGLEEKDKEACRLSIQYLQVGFDAALAEDDDEQGYRYQMIFLWTLLAPAELTSLLAAKRPEVLVMLAYYALLLHYGRNMWQVGDAGVYVLNIIVDYLGPDWVHWLEYPREMIAKDLK